jgi:hypothetical protein
MKLRLIPLILPYCFFAVSLPVLAADPPNPESGDVVWLEAEQFADCGGWSNDSQFVALMGSPYLLATGVGKPVADAVTKAHVPRPGQYRLWVRCKDWYPPVGQVGNLSPTSAVGQVGNLSGNSSQASGKGQVANLSYSPGRFQVIVAGRTSKTTFGQAKDDRWQWIDGGAFDIQTAEVEVRLHDLTGWWGRCDAVVLAGDKGFRPADDLGELAKQRETYGGVAREITQPGPYDVVVVGGGLAGAAAAIAAARLGNHVALVQDRPVLGGNASTEIGVPPQGDTTREPLDPGETGIIEEFDPKGGGHRDWSTPMEKVVRTQKNLDLFLNTRATGVAMKDKTTMDAVEALDVRAGTRYRFAGRLFIDCTGDGWIGFWAGAEYRHGSEGRDEYGETIAGDSANTQTMGNTIYAMNFRTHDKPIPFEAPPWAYKWTSPEDFDKDPVGAYQTKGERPPNFDNLTKGRGREPKTANAGHHEWWVELGGMHDTIKDAEWIRDELLRINVGLWDYAKNYNPKFKDANQNKELAWMNYVPGTRESRRLLGNYVMTQKDYADKIVHRDTIAYCGWGTDIHHPWGFFAKGNEYYSGFHQKQSIPYRSIYSKNISNLLMAGRDISVSHIALGSTRVMRTCCIIGQAAGTAAAIANLHYTTPRGVYEKYLDELQDQLLKDGAYLMGRPNRDARDLARSATVSASSFASIPNPRLAKKKGISGGLIHDLNMARAVMFTAGGAGILPVNLNSVALYLRSDRDTSTSLRAVLRVAKKLGDFSETANLAEAAASIPPKSSGWIEFKLGAKLEPGKPYYVALPRSDGLKWDLYPTQPEGTARAYGGPKWTLMAGCYKFRLNPGGEPTGAGSGGTGILPVSNHGQDAHATTSSAAVRLEPGNVVGGWNRAVAGAPNSWAPDPRQPLPQWIELTFKQPVQFNTVHVTFQLASMAAAAYRLDAGKDGKEWKTVARADNNTQRRGIHSFAPVTADRLRLVLESSSTSGTLPRVCEIRVYDEPAK